MKFENFFCTGSKDMDNYPKKVPQFEWLVSDSSGISMDANFSVKASQ